MNRMTKIPSLYSGRYVPTASNNKFVQVTSPFSSGNTIVGVTCNKFNSSYVVYLNNGSNGRIDTSNGIVTAISNFSGGAARDDDYEVYKVSNADVIYRISESMVSYYTDAYGFLDIVQLQNPDSPNLVNNRLLNFGEGLLAYNSNGFNYWYSTVDGITFGTLNTYADGIIVLSDAYDKTNDMICILGDSQSAEYAIWNGTNRGLNRASNTLLGIPNTNGSDNRYRCVSYQELTGQPSSNRMFIGGDTGAIVTYTGFTLANLTTNKSDPFYQYCATQLAQFSPADSISCFGATSNYFYAGTSTGKLAKSADGVSWYSVDFFNEGVAGKIVGIIGDFDGKLLVVGSNNFFATLDLALE